jgi:hypothetical protein
MQKSCDEDDHRDGCLCDVKLGTHDALTSDEELPRAHGGVVCGRSTEKLKAGHH